MTSPEETTRPISYGRMNLFQKDFIKDHWDDMDLVQLSELLGFSMTAIRNQAKHMGLPPKIENHTADRRKSTEHAKAYIIAHWDKMSAAQIARNIGINKDTVRIYAEQMGLPAKTKAHTDNYTMSEPELMDYIRSNYANMTRSELAEATGYSPSKIYKCIVALKLPPKTGTRPKPEGRRFSSTELDAYIKEHWATISTNQIAADTGYGSSTISRHAKDLGLPAKNEMLAQKRAFPEKDLDTYLSANWEKTSLRALSKATGYNVHALRKRAAAIGLAPKSCQKPMSEDEAKAYVKAHWNKELMDRLVDATGRSSFTLRKYAVEMGLPSKTEIQAKRHAAETECIKHLILEHHKKMSVTELAGLAGCHTNTIYKYAQELGVSVSNIAYRRQEQ